MNRLMEDTVLSGLVMACLFAGSPTFRSPFSTHATTEGVVLFPSLLGITTGSFPSITETQEFVVPKSIPIILPMSIIFECFQLFCLIFVNDYASSIIVTFYVNMTFYSRYFCHNSGFM